MFRRIPPVYTAITRKALWNAVRSQQANCRASAITAATARLAVEYPGREIVLTNSGTSALTLALCVTRPADGRVPAVALPAYACPDVGTAAIGADYRIVLYDVDPTTLQPELSSLSRCLEAGATHVLAVHLFGRLIDMHPLTSLCAAFDALVIEDAAQHAGATAGGIRGGALADWSILSFGRGKGLNAGGGGALLRASEAASEVRTALEIPSRGDSVRAVLSTIAAEWLSHPSIYWLPAAIPALRLGDTVYHSPETVRAISTGAAQLLHDAIETEPVTLRRRRATERRYQDALGEVPHLTLTAPPNEVRSGALRFPVRLTADIARQLARYGVVRSYPRTLAEYEDLLHHRLPQTESLAGATELASTLYTLPTHTRIRAEEVEQLIQAVLALTASRSHR